MNIVIINNRNHEFPYDSVDSVAEALHKYCVDELQLWTKNSTLEEVTDSSDENNIISIDGFQDNIEGIENIDFKIRTINGLCKKSKQRIKAVLDITGANNENASGIIKPNVMIVTDRYDQYEFIIDDLRPLVKECYNGALESGSFYTHISAALDRYIEEIVGLETNFSASALQWKEINGYAFFDGYMSSFSNSSDKTIDENLNLTETAIQNKIELINGLCKRARHKIKKYYINYTKIYPLTVTFTDYKGLRVYNNNVRTIKPVTVQYGDSVKLRLAADKGFVLANYSASQPINFYGYYYLNMRDDNGNITYPTVSYDPKSQLIVFNNIHDQVVIKVNTIPITEGDWCIQENIDSVNKIDYSYSYQPDPDNTQVSMEGAEYAATDLFYFDYSPDIDTYTSMAKYLADGSGYQVSIIPIQSNSLTFIPKVKVIKEGVDITDTSYAFDKNSWKGLVTIKEGEVNGNIDIDVTGVELYKATYTLTIYSVGPDGSIYHDMSLFTKMTQPGISASPGRIQQATLQHWQYFTVTANPPPGWQVDNMTVTVNNEDVTQNFYQPVSIKDEDDKIIGTTHKVEISHITGNVVIVSNISPKPTEND